MLKVSIEIFGNKELFFGLSDEQMGLLATVAEQVIYCDGQTIFNEGEMGDALVIVQSGGVDLFKKADHGGEIKLATLPAGAVMGEMTLINIERRSATAKAAGDTIAVFLKNSDLVTIFNQDRELFIVLLINITRILSKRLRQANEKLMSK